MRRFALAGVMTGGVFFQGNIVRAQSTLEALQQELNEAKQAHQDVTAQSLANFFAQVDPAMASPDAAVALYQLAGGALPDPSPVITQNEDETATEKAARLAYDQANVSRMGVVLQLQCGLMHYAALFVVKPDQTGLQNQWVDWLNAAAQIYPQTAMPQPPSDPVPDLHKKKSKDNDPKPHLFDPSDLKGKAMKDTLISKFLAFKAWADKEQGGWSVHDLPRLYRTNVLEPLRTAPTPATLSAWDAYIAMANADEKDNNQWNQVDFPPLQFDRASDDYLVTPSTEKLEGLVNLIKANPTNPHADDWIARVSQFMSDYRAHHGGAPAPQGPSTTATPSAANPSVVVTTQQQGDATIITTQHTNSAPVSPSAH
jgi:hypothetical protein